jgi:glucan phosphoethanolaminetransferase (alkaline phosphatase superfamily)
MPGDFPIKGPQEIWQNQPTEPLKMSATDLRRKALEAQSKARFAVLFTIIIAIMCCVVFAWSLASAHPALARMGFGLVGLCMIYAAYHAYKWTWPGNLPEEAPINTCLEFYRRALERQRDYSHRRWRSGLPVLILTLLGVVMAAVGTGARNAPPHHPLLNALPFFLALAIWVVAFLILRKKQGRKILQREIEELRAFERENR